MWALAGYVHNGSLVCEPIEMPQQERPEERRARDVVAHLTGHDLQFTDLRGGIDYAVRDMSVALEVTRFTERRVRRDMSEAARNDHMLDLGTSYDWRVTFDGFPKYNNLVVRLYAPLLRLENHELERYSRSQDWWMRHVPTLKEATSCLLAQGVLHARATVPDKWPSRLFISPSQGWVYGGPDAALELLESAIGRDTNHIQKLGVTEAIERHLWYWTDMATPDDFRRALAIDGGLPSRAPKLPAEVTHLWCVDISYSRGWRWAPSSGWAWMTAPSSVDQNPA